MSANQRSTPPPEPGAPPPVPANDGGCADLPPAPLTRQQQALVAMALGDVQRCATEVARLYRRRFTAEEMLGPGTLGLLAAARVYDAVRNPTFRHNARF